MSGSPFAPTWDPALPDDSLQAGMYTCLTFCMLVLLASTGFRVFVKWTCGLHIRKDDWALLVSTMLNFAANILQYLALRNGFGRHAQFLSIGQLSSANSFAMVLVPLGVIANAATKLSMFFFVLSLIEGTHKKLYYTVVTTSGITALVGVLFVVLWAARAVPGPLYSIGDSLAPGPQPEAWIFVETLYAIGALGIFTDALYSLSPLYFLRNVNIASRNKASIQVLVGSEVVVILIAIVGLVYARAFHTVVDMTWTLGPRYTCDILERNLSVLLANLPMIQVLLNKRTELFRTSDGTDDEDGGDFARLKLGRSSNGSRLTGAPSRATDLEFARGDSAPSSPSSMHFPPKAAAIFLGGHPPVPGSKAARILGVQDAPWAAPAASCTRSAYVAWGSTAPSLWPPSTITFKGQTWPVRAPCSSWSGLACTNPSSSFTPALLPPLPPLPPPPSAQKSQAGSRKCSSLYSQQPDWHRVYMPVNDRSLSHVSRTRQESFRS